MVRGCWLLVIAMAACSIESPDFLPAIDAPAGGAIDAAPAPLPVDVSGYMVSTGGLAPAGVAQVEGTVVVVGSHAPTPASSNGALLIAVTDGPQVQTFSASGPVELETIATSGGSMMMAGRMLGGSGGEQGILVRGTFLSGYSGVVLSYPGEPVRVTGAAALPSGWAVVGPNGGQLLLVLVDQMLQIDMALHLSLDGTASALSVGRVVSEGSRLYVVGSFAVGGQRRGWAAALETTGGMLSPVWGVSLGAAAALDLIDVTPSGSELEVVGRLGEDGVLVRLDRVTGTVAESALLPGLPLSTVVRSGGALWVAGDAGAGPFAGRLDTALAGVRFEGFSLPSQGGAALLPGPAEPTLLLGRAGAVVLAPLNRDPRAACAGAPYGVPFTVAMAPVAVTTSKTGVGGSGIALATTAGVAINRLTPMPAAACP